MPAEKLTNSSSIVEDVYEARVRAMTAGERLIATAEMLETVVNIVATQVTAELGELPPEILRLEVAKRLYRGERETLALIDKRMRMLMDK